MVEQSTTETIAPEDVAVSVGARVRHGVRKPHNWMQLLKFAAVGATGYVVNLVVYEVARTAFDVHYMVAAVLAFLVAVTNNFFLNRHWTFDARAGHAGFQAARFLTVSVLALGFNLAVLKVLVTVVGMGEFPAQAIAVICATPLNFLGNKLWSFN